MTMMPKLNTSTYIYVNNLSMVLYFFFKTFFLGLAYLLKLVGPERDKSPLVFSLKNMYSYKCINICKK